MFGWGDSNWIMEDLMQNIQNARYLNQNLKSKFKLFFGLGASILMMACLSACMSESPSPEARERARQVLEETSPRNMNDHPKVTCPNVGYTIPRCGRARAEVYDQSACSE